MGPKRIKLSFLKILFALFSYLYLLLSFENSFILISFFLIIPTDGFNNEAHNIQRKGRHGTPKLAPHGQETHQAATPPAIRLRNPYVQPPRHPFPPPLPRPPPPPLQERDRQQRPYFPTPFQLRRRPLGRRRRRRRRVFVTTVPPTPPPDRDGALRRN